MEKRIRKLVKVVKALTELAIEIGTLIMIVRAIIQSV